MRKWATFRHLSAQLLNEVLEEVELRQIEDLWLRGSESDEHLEFSDLFGIDWTGHVWIILENFDFVNASQRFATQTD